MKINKKAFTLVELLVVILIIGILAAIAVPQYQLAIEKSRASEAFTLLKSIAQAYEVYYLSHPSDTTPTLADLDIDIPGKKSKSGSYSVINTQHYTIYLWPSPHALRTISEKPAYYIAYYKSKQNFYCILPERTKANYNSKYTAVCKSLGGVQDQICYDNEADNADACFKLQ